MQLQKDICCYWAADKYASDVKKQFHFSYILECHIQLNRCVLFDTVFLLMYFQAYECFNIKLSLWEPYLTISTHILLLPKTYIISKITNLFIFLLRLHSTLLYFKLPLNIMSSMLHSVCCVAKHQLNIFCQLVFTPELILITLNE